MLPGHTSLEAKALFLANIRLAYKCAQRWWRLLGPRKLEREDLIQIALLGLWKACLHWDPAQGSLGTLAYWVIANEVRNALREQRKYPSSVPWGDTRRMERLYYAQDLNVYDPQRTVLLREAWEALPKRSKELAPYGPEEGARMVGYTGTSAAYKHRHRAKVALKGALAEEH